VQAYSLIELLNRPQRFQASLLAEHRLRLGMNWIHLAILGFTNILLLTVSFGLLSPLVQARSFRFTMSLLRSEGQVDLDIATQAAVGPNQAEGLADALDL
jgi:uncharacterized membrane protein YjgN (DUF898 family)